MIKFDSANHQYTVDEKKVISVTQLLRKHNLAPDYSAVNEVLLKSSAEKGTLIHEEIENYVTKGEVGFTSELMDFIELCAKHNIKPLGAEMKVGNDIVAGTVDLLATIDKDTIVIDTKTTSVLHKEYVRWQVSLYNYLLKGWGTKVGVLHLVEGKSAFIELEPIPVEEIERLLECERQNTIYGVDLQIDHKELEQMFEFEARISILTAEMNKVKYLQEEMKKRLYDQMTASNCKKFESDKIIITRVLPSTSETIDSKRLRAEKPDIAREYSKTTTKDGYVRIKIK